MTWGLAPANSTRPARSTRRGSRSVSPPSPTVSISAGSFTVTPSASSGLPIALTVVPSSTGSASISDPVAGVFTVTPTRARPHHAASDAGRPTAPIDYESNVLTQSFTASGVALLTITTQPISQSAVTGSAASFSVKASGTTALSYRWQWSADGSTWSDLANDSTYSGVATDTLSVSGAAMALNGRQYRCVVTNAAGSVTSNAASLRVLLPDQAFLQHLFLDVLGRPVDSGAVASFGAALAGGESRAAVLGGLLASTEYTNRQIEPAIRLYSCGLGAMPDYAGLQNWSNALQAGTFTLAGAADQFAASAEFNLKYGCLDDTGYVQQLYRNVLGREADTDGPGRLAGLSRRRAQPRDGARRLLGVA